MLNHSDTHVPRVPVGQKGIEEPGGSAENRSNRGQEKFSRDEPPEMFRKGFAAELGLDRIKDLL